MKLGYWALGVFGVPLSAWASEAAAPVVSAGSNVSGQLVQLTLGLLVVVALIFVLAWLLKRMQQVGPRSQQAIKLVANQALGPRDRLVLVQVGNEQVLLGISPGRIAPLHVLKEPVSVESNSVVAPEFAQKLMELLGKDKDAKQ